MCISTLSSKLFSKKKNKRQDNVQRTTVVARHGESAASTTGPGLGHGLATLEAEKNTGLNRSWGEHHEIHEGLPGGSQRGGRERERAEGCHP